MTDHALDGLTDQPAARALLEAYAKAEFEAAAVAPPAESAAPSNSSAGDLDADEADRSVLWVPRLTNVSGTDAAALPALHGKLIALGLLKFELFGRAGGIRYRLSPLGRSSLQTPAARTEAADAPESAEELVAA